MTDTQNTSSTPLSEGSEQPGYRPVALVAGASRGLGLLIAKELATRGCQPVICARDAEELDRAAKLLQEWGHPTREFVCDVADHEAVEALVQRVEREIGPVEVAVHVAGVIQVGPLASMTREHFVEAIDVMQWGPINLALAVLPGMRERGRGHIGTVTSIGGLVSVPHLLPYSTAKFAAVGFSQGLGAELADTNISVTTIVPGLMRTGSHLRAEFSGNHGAEYAWFAPGASLPLVSMGAERAAARIAQGVLDGRRLILLTPLTKVAARFSGVAPATTTALMGVMARLLPDAPPGRAADRRGSQRQGEAQLLGRRTAHHPGNAGCRPPQRDAVGGQVSRGRCYVDFPCLRAGSTDSPYVLSMSA